MKIPILALIFQGIPETIAWVTLAFVIAKIPLSWKKLIPMGILLAIASYLIRQLPVTFGIHTVILIGLMLGVLVLWGKGSLNDSLIASLTSLLALLISENICVIWLWPIFGMSPEKLTTDIVLRILTGMPQVIMIFLLALLIYKIRESKTAEDN